MLPKLNLTFSSKAPKKDKTSEPTREPPGPLKRSPSSATEKTRRATGDSGKIQSSRRNKARDTLVSRPQPFGIGHSDAVPQDRAPSATLETPRTPASPRGKQPITAPLNWTDGAKGTGIKALALSGLAGEEDSATEPLTTPRRMLSARRETAKQALKRLLNGGLITVAETPHGEPTYRVSDKVDEHDLWRACIGLPLNKSRQVQRACALLDAALPFIRDPQLRMKLLDSFAPAISTHFDGFLPLDRWPTLCQGILDFQLSVTAPRVASALQGFEDEVELLEIDKSLSPRAGAALLSGLHKLLTLSLQIDHPDQTRAILDLAERVMALCEVTQRFRSYEGQADDAAGLKRLHKAADALYASWQQGVPLILRTPAYLALFDPSEDPASGGLAPRIRMAGRGAAVRFRVDGPLDEQDHAAVAEVCRQWLLTGWSGEAAALLDAVFATVTDPQLRHGLADTLTEELSPLLQSGHQAVGLKCIELLARLHRHSALPPDRIEAMLNLVTVCFADTRDDFIGLRALNAAAQALEQAIAQQPKPLSPSLRWRCAELASAIRDALGPMEQFQQRWKLGKDGHGVLQTMSYIPGRVRGDAQALQQQAQSLALKARALGLEEGGAQRSKLMELLSRDPKELSEKQKQQLADQLDLFTQEHALRGLQETHFGDLAYERSMLIADIERLLQDPKGPRWPEVKLAIQAACKALGWTPSAQQWLSWSIVAAGRGEPQALEEHILQWQMAVQQSHERQQIPLKDHGLSETRAALFQCLCDLMDKHLPWEHVQRAQQSVLMARGWTLTDTQQASLCLTQAQRGDPAPLIDLLSKPNSVALPPSELGKLLLLLDHPELPRQWARLRKLVEPLFLASEILLPAYQSLPAPTTWSSGQNPAQAVHRPAVPPLQLTPFGATSAQPLNIPGLRRDPQSRALTVLQSPRGTVHGATAAVQVVSGKPDTPDQSTQDQSTPQGSSASSSDSSSEKLPN